MYYDDTPLSRNPSRGQVEAIVSIFLLCNRENRITDTLFVKSRLDIVRRLFRRSMNVNNHRRILPAALDCLIKSADSALRESTERIQRNGGVNVSSYKIYRIFKHFVVCSWTMLVVGSWKIISSKDKSYNTN